MELLANSTFPLLFAVCFPVFFIGLWCLIVSILSRVGGWGKLAEQFRYEGQPNGQKYGMQSLSLGGVNYNNCLTMHVAPEGLYVSTWWIFRLKHPTLCIPWKAFHPGKEKKFLWIRYYQFEIGHPVITKAVIQKKTYEAIQQFVRMEH